MPVYDLFSKRQKRSRGEVPDVYQYETIPKELRIQVVHIWRDALGEPYDNHVRDLTAKAYEFLHNTLCREYGEFTLGGIGDSALESVHNFFLETKETEKAIDVIELLFKFIDIVPYQFSHRKISPKQAIDELNHRFREHGVGYQYEYGQIIRVDSQLIHSEVVRPALSMLADPMYEGANAEFLSAHEHYRSRKYKECLNDCLKSFESCIKAICKKRGWNYNEQDTANRLIEIVFDKGLIPTFMQSHFSALKSTLASGVPTVRNRLSGHGQGSKEVSVPESIAAYALHLTASNILLLARSDDEMK